MSDEEEGKWNEPELVMLGSLPFTDPRRNWFTLKEQGAVARYPWKKSAPWFSLAAWRLATVHYNAVRTLRLANGESYMEIAIPAEAVTTVVTE